MDSIADLSLARPVSPTSGAALPIEIEIEIEVLGLFDRTAPSLQRYISSFGLSTEECEDIVQDVFLLLFRHLHLGRSRANLRAWLFQVAHNQALKQRGRTRRRQARAFNDEDAIDRYVDAAPDPETQAVERDRRRRLMSIVRALPERDRRCLSLRAEGLRYRDIASALGVSLGTVAKSLTRAISRLATADKR